MRQVDCFIWEGWPSFSVAAGRLRAAFSEQQGKSEGVFLQVTNQPHLLDWPYVFLFFWLQLSLPAQGIYLLVSGSRSAKITPKFLLPDKLGWVTGSFQAGWGEVDNIYITHPRISYLGSLPLHQLGQIKDFTSLRNMWDGPWEVWFFVLFLNGLHSSVLVHL